MRFIFHQNSDSDSTPDNYSLGKVMLYFLGEKLYLSGIGEYFHLMIECYDNLDTRYKLQKLIDWSEDDIKKSYVEAMASVKLYPKIKNKSSKYIVGFNQLKKGIEEHFKNKLQERYESMDKLYDLATFRPLIDYQNVAFYHNEEYHSIHVNPKITTVTEILSLQLPDDDGECPILFLTNENINDEPNLELTVLSPDSKRAKDLDKIYLTDVFQFPSVIRMHEAMMRSMAIEFSKKAKSFKEKLNQWAKICYDNPNTSKGLTFFREQIVPSIEEYKKTSFETNVGKELLNVSIPENFGFLQFGEMPVEKIWKLMLASKNCTEEEYNELVKLKENNPSKYQGRWPVVFFREEKTQKFPKEKEQSTVPTKRKTLDID